MSEPSVRLSSANPDRALQSLDRAILDSNAVALVGGGAVLDEVRDRRLDVGHFDPPVVETRGALRVGLLRQRLAQIAEAHDLVESGRAGGNIVLEVE